ncbi:MAG: Dephospho-CoA kinase [Actinobacteria bacterium ADurb.Bin346]|nr:MAG: Dephospho-CoA kinase [Actinobacteria bacterium ADurb.Bin346]
MIIGIAGRVGSGKSTIANYLAGCFKESLIIDADKVAKEIYCADSSAREEVRACFGDCVIDKDGQVDYLKLGRLVFSSQEKLCRLNDIMLFRIEAAIKEKINKNSRKKIIIIDAAVLFGTDLYRICDFIIWLKAPEKRRRELLQLKSGTEPEEINRRIRGQLIKKIPSKIDFNVDNSGSLAELQNKAKEIAVKIRASRLFQQLNG